MYIDYLICYGRGIASIAKQLGTSEKEAQNIYDSVLDIFKGLKKFDEDSKRFIQWIRDVNKLHDLTYHWKPFKPGSVVKGYAADKIYEYLKSINIKNALIDA